MAAVNLDYGGHDENENEIDNYDIDAAVQELISGMEKYEVDDEGRLLGGARVNRDIRLPVNMRTDEVNEGDLAEPSRRYGEMADEEDMLLNEMSERSPPRRSALQLRLLRYFGSGRCVWHLCLIAISVFLITVASMVIHKMKNQPASQSGISTEASVPEPPNDIELICSKHYIVDLKKTEKDCSEACSPAQCCYKKDQPSCYASHAESCSAYAVCLLLEQYATLSGFTGKNYVTMPPEDLVTTCASANITTDDGLQSCEDMCNPSACCFASRPADNCFSYKDNFESCNAYKTSCSILGEDFGGLPDLDDEDLVIPEPPATLSSVCSDPSNTELMSKCREQCAPAFCCNSDDPAISCFYDNEAVCTKYMICNVLTDETPGDNLADAPSDLAMMCDDPTNPGYLATCEQLCEQSECCRTTLANETCADNPVCDGYEPCKNLEQYEASIIPPPPDDLDDLCSSDSISASRQPCNDACVVAACCWASIEDASCQLQNADVCASYSGACEVLKFNPPEAPSDLSDICSNIDISDEGFDFANGWLNPNYGGETTCLQACADAYCCVAEDDDDSCITYHRSRCAGYTTCVALDPIYDILMALTEVNTTVLQESDDDLAIKCSSILTQDAGHSAECQAACAPADCCSVSSGEKQNCFNANRDACNSYGICFVLPEVAQACDHDSLITVDGQAECQRLCKDHACCFEQGTDGETCWYDQWDECVKYAPCFSLLGINNGELDPAESVPANPPTPGSVTVPPKPHDLNEKCAGVLKGQEETDQCKAACAPADCCEAEDDTNCFSDNEQTCSSYGICFVLPEVSRACSHSSLETDSGHQTCYDFCYPRACCFSSGQDNCYDSDRQNCMKYAPCFTLLSFHGGELPDPEPEDDDDIPKVTPVTLTLQHADIARVCEMDSPEFDDVQCEESCSSAQCCVSDDDTQNCYETSEDACLSYSPCFTDPDVVQYCTKQNLSSEETRNLCLEVCAPYSCCYGNLTNTTDCPSDSPHFCLMYMPCAAVAFLLDNEYSGSGGVDDVVVGPTPALDVLCKAESIEGLFECFGFCQSKLCCFAEDDTNCAADPAFDCADSQACSAVLPPKDLSTTCSETSVKTADGQRQCLDACGPAFCCSLGDNKMDTCNQDFCDLYGECHYLWGK